MPHSPIRSRKPTRRPDHCEAEDVHNRSICALRSAFGITGGCCAYSAGRMLSGRDSALHDITLRDGCRLSLRGAARQIWAVSLREAVAAGHGFGRCGPERRYAGRSMPARQSGRRMGTGGRIRFTSTPSRPAGIAMRATATRRFLSRDASGAPESDHLRPRPGGRYRHPNRAESAGRMGDGKITKPSGSHDGRAKCCSAHPAGASGWLWRALPGLGSLGR